MATLNAGLTALQTTMNGPVHRRKSASNADAVASATATKAALEWWQKMYSNPTTPIIPIASGSRQGGGSTTRSSSGSSGVTTGTTRRTKGTCKTSTTSNPLEPCGVNIPGCDGTYTEEFPPEIAKYNQKTWGGCTRAKVRACGDGANRWKALFGTCSPDESCEDAYQAVVDWQDVRVSYLERALGFEAVGCTLTKTGPSTRRRRFKSGESCAGFEELEKKSHRSKELVSTGFIDMGKWNHLLIAVDASLRKAVARARRDICIKSQKEGWSVSSTTCQAADWHDITTDPNYATQNRRLGETVVHEFQNTLKNDWRLELDDCNEMEDKYACEGARHCNRIKKGSMKSCYYRIDGEGQAVCKGDDPNDTKDVKGFGLRLQYRTPNPKDDVTRRRRGGKVKQHEKVTRHWVFTYMFSAHINKQCKNFMHTNIAFADNSDLVTATRRRRGHMCNNKKKATRRRKRRL